MSSGSGKFDVNVDDMDNFTRQVNTTMQSVSESSSPLHTGKFEGGGAVTSVSPSSGSTHLPEATDFNGTYMDWIDGAVTTHWDHFNDFYDVSKKVSTSRASYQDTDDEHSHKFMACLRKKNS
jgi:phosphoribosyl 1,2-cyclic phosphodiesterase